MGKLSKSRRSNLEVSPVPALLMGGETLGRLPGLGGELNSSVKESDSLDL